MKTKLTFFIYFFAFHFAFSQNLFNKKYQCGMPPDYFLRTMQLPAKSYFLYGGWEYPVAGLLSKIDSNGTMLWAKKIEYPIQFLGFVPVLCSGVLDHNQDVLIVTQYTYPYIGSLLKVSNSGNQIWDLRFDFPISDVVLTSDSNYAVIGRKSGPVNGLYPEIQFYKISPTGAVIFGYEYWKNSGIVNYNGVEKKTYGILQHPDGNYFALVNVAEEIMVIKIDVNGQAVWNRTYLQSVFDQYFDLKPALWKMLLMPDNTMLICGQIGDFLGNHRNELVCFKIDSDGNVLWSKKCSPSVFRISHVNTILNPDSTINIFLGLADSSQNQDHAILKIDQNGNFVNSFSLRTPQKPVYPIWFGEVDSNNYHFIQVNSAGNNTIQIISMSSSFYSPCMTDTFAGLTLQNFTVSALDSFPLVAIASTTVPVPDTLTITSKNFSTIDFCAPTEINILNKAEDHLTVYPNPASEVLHADFNFPESKNILLQVINPIREIIYDETIKNNTVNNSRKVNLKKFAGGIYFLRLQTDDEIFIRKFIVR